MGISREEELQAKTGYNCLRNSYIVLGVPHDFPEWADAIAQDPTLVPVWAHFAQKYQPLKKLTDEEETIGTYRQSTITPILMAVDATYDPISNPQTIRLRRPDHDGYNKLFKALLKAVNGWSWSLDESDDGLTWSFTLLEKKKA